MRIFHHLMIMVAVSGAVPSAPTTADSTAAVRAAFERYDAGWRRFDAGTVTNAFADQFEWVNEVGLRFSDKGRLTRFLRQIFVDPDFRAGTPAKLVIHSIKFLGPKVAVISSSEETDGQRDSATGKTVPALHTNELTVMKLQGRRWLIVRDLTSDEAHGI